MSDFVLAVIPTHPSWVPDAAHEAAARAVVEEIVPVPDAVETHRRGQVEFIGAGENFESVRCPACAAVIEMNWWAAQMDRQWTDNGFGPLDVVAPCCDAVTTLNDLKYHWPQGFASWSITVKNSNRGQLDDAERAHIESALGHPVRLVYAHY